jgi:hypothetical protein
MRKGFMTQQEVLDRLDAEENPLELSIEKWHRVAEQIRMKVSSNVLDINIRDDTCALCAHYKHCGCADCAYFEYYDFACCDDMGHWTNFLRTFNRYLDMEECPSTYKWRVNRGHLYQSAMAMERALKRCRRK